MAFEYGITSGWTIDGAAQWVRDPSGLGFARFRAETRYRFSEEGQAPLDLAFPDASLPATNDCWYHIGLAGEVGHGIPNADGFYEMAFGWFRDPMFAWVVGENRRRNGPRRTLEALLDGAPEIPMVKRGESNHGNKRDARENLYEPLRAFLLSRWTSIHSALQ